MGTSVEQTQLLPTREPRFEVMKNPVKVNIDNQNLDFSEINSSLGKQGSFYNYRTQNNKVLFDFKAGTTFRLDLKNSYLRLGFKFRVERADGTDIANCTYSNTGFSPWLPFMLISNISIKQNYLM